MSLSSADRRATLAAALGLALEPREPELQMLHRCFDTWRGIGDIVAGIARQEYDLELRRYDGARLACGLFPERLRALVHFVRGVRGRQCSAVSLPTWSDLSHE
jgi:hypothetical protein